MALIAEEFCLFAKLHRDRVETNREGLAILEEYDHISVITGQGDFSQKSFGMKKQNAIWISRYPQFNHTIKRYIVLLTITGDNIEAIKLGNKLCSFISTIMLLMNYDRMSMAHLSLNADHKQKTAALAGFRENNEAQEFIEKDQELQDLLRQENVDTSGYPSIDGFECPYINREQKWVELLMSVKNILEGSFGSAELLHGHIIRIYTQKLCEQQKKEGRMNPVKAQEDIQIDEEFEEYLQIIGKYNNRCRSKLSQEANPRLKELLTEVRDEVEEENLFKNNQHYAEKLEKYMNRKEIELRKLNEQYEDNQSLEYLNTEAGKLIKKVKKQDNTKASVDRQLNKLIEHYNSKCRSKSKDKLLTDFLQVFTPTLYSEAGISQDIEKKLKKVKKENKDLEAELDKIRKKNQKCCSLM